MKKKLLLASTIIAILIFILIAMLINSDFISFVDSSLYEKMIDIRSDYLTFIMLIFTRIGSTIGVIVVCVLLFINSKTRKKLAWPVTVSVITAVITNNLIKVIVSRPRPNYLRIIEESGYSFPSGHAMVNMALYLTIIFILIKYFKSKKAKYLISICCLIMPLFIGISRIYLGVHYFSDVFAGWILGFAITAIVSLLYIKRNEGRIK